MRIGAFDARPEMIAERLLLALRLSRKVLCRRHCHNLDRLRSGGGTRAEFRFNTSVDNGRGHRLGSRNLSRDPAPTAGCSPEGGSSNVRMSVHRSYA
jgi:hypothetical protein